MHVANVFKTPKLRTLQLQKTARNISIEIVSNFIMKFSFQNLDQEECFQMIIFWWHFTFLVSSVMEAGLCVSTWNFQGWLWPWRLALWDVRFLCMTITIVTLLKLVGPVPETVCNNFSIILVINLFSTNFLTKVLFVSRVFISRGTFTAYSVLQCKRMIVLDNLSMIRLK